MHPRQDRDDEGYARCQAELALTVWASPHIEHSFYKNAAGEVMTQITPEEIRQMIDDGSISGGMIPKTETALMALEAGTRAVTILDGRIPNACILELFTDHGAGSQIRSTEPRIKPRVRR